MADRTVEIAELVLQYQDLMLNQYRNAERARATIALLVQEAICSLVELDIQDAFNLDTAIGVQLDVLGQYIGFDRNVTIPIDRFYFKYTDYLNPVSLYAGFTLYTDSTVNAGSSWYLYSFSDTPNTSLDDDTYRTLLKLKIILNKSHNTLYEIATDLWQFFAGDIICFDSADMTISYAVNPNAKSVAIIAAQVGLLPKPMAVGISGIFLIPDPTKIFGFQDYLLENSNTLGFSDYLTGFNGQQWVNYSDRI